MDHRLPDNMEDEALSQHSLITLSQISPPNLEEKELLGLYEKRSKKQIANIFLDKKYSNSIRGLEEEVKVLKAQFTEARKGLAGKAQIEKCSEIEKSRKECAVENKYLKTVITKQKLRSKENIEQLLAAREEVQQTYKTCSDIIKGTENVKQQMKDKPDALVTKHIKLKKKIHEIADYFKLNPKNQDLIFNEYDMVMAQLDEYLLREKDRDKKKCDKYPYFFDETKVVTILKQSNHPFLDELEKVRIGLRKEESSEFKNERTQMQVAVMDEVVPTIETRKAENSIDVQFPNNILPDTPISNEIAGNVTLGNYPYQDSSRRTMKDSMLKNASQEKVVQVLDSAALHNVETSSAGIMQHKETFSVKNYLQGIEHNYGNEKNDEQSIICGKSTYNRPAYSLPMFTAKPESNEVEMIQDFSMLALKKPMYDRTNITESPIQGLKREKRNGKSDKDYKQMTYEKPIQAMEVDENVMNPEDSIAEDYDFQSMIKKIPESHIDVYLLEKAHFGCKYPKNFKIHDDNLQLYRFEESISRRCFSPCTTSNDACDNHYPISENSYRSLIDHESIGAPDYEENAVEFPDGKFPDDAKSLLQFKQQLKRKVCVSGPPCSPLPEHLVIPPFSSEYQLSAKFCPSRPLIPFNKNEMNVINSPDNAASSSVTQDFIDVKGLGKVDSSAKPSDICPSLTVSKSKKHARKMRTLPYQPTSRGITSHKEFGIYNTSLGLDVDQKNLQSHFNTVNEHKKEVKREEKELEENTQCLAEFNEQTLDMNISFLENPNFQGKHEIEGRGHRMSKVHYRISKDGEKNVDLASKPKNEDSVSVLQTSTAYAENNLTLKSVNCNKFPIESRTNSSSAIDKLNSPFDIGQILKSSELSCSTHDTMNDFSEKLHQAASIPTEDNIGLARKMDKNIAQGDQCEEQSFRLPVSDSKEFKRETVGRQRIENEQGMYTLPLHMKESDSHIAPTEVLQSRSYGDKENVRKYRKGVCEQLRSNIETKDNLKSFVQLRESISMQNMQDNAGKTTIDDPDILQAFVSCKVQGHSVIDLGVNQNTYSLESGECLNNFDSSKHLAEREFYQISESAQNSESSHFIATPEISSDQTNPLVDYTAATSLPFFDCKMDEGIETLDHMKKSHIASDQTIVLSSDDEQPSSSPSQFQKSGVPQSMFNIKEKSVNISHPSTKEKTIIKPPLQEKKQTHSRKIMSTDYLQFLYPCFDNKREIMEENCKEGIADASCHNVTSVDNAANIKDMNAIHIVQPRTSNHGISEDPSCGQLDELKPIPQNKEVSKSTLIFPGNDQSSKLNDPFVMSQQIHGDDFAKNVCTPDDEYLMKLMGDYDSQLCSVTITPDTFNSVRNYSAEGTLKDTVSPLKTKLKKSDTYVPFDFEKFMKPPSDTPESPPTPFQMTSRNMFSSKNSVPGFANRKKEDAKASGFQTIEEIMKKCKFMISSPNVEKRLDDNNASTVRQDPKGVSMHSEFLQGFSKQK